MQNRKSGMTLIEVVVALSVIILVFSVVTTVIIQSINLAMAAKDKTEASGLLQMALADGVGVVSKDGCPNTTGTFSITGYAEIPGQMGNFQLTNSVNGKTVYLYLNKDNYDDVDWAGSIDPVDGSAPSINSTNFYKVSAKVVWDYKNFHYEEKSDQYVGKE